MTIGSILSMANCPIRIGEQVVIKLGIALHNEIKGVQKVRSAVYHMV